MSKLGQLKKKWEYEPSVPRCGECISFRETFVRLTTNSQTKRINQHCSRGGFTVSRNGICNFWTSKSGEKLDCMGDAA